MLYSFNKLKQLANLDAKITIEDVSKAINSIGFEVEKCRPFTNVKGIKFGRVLATSKNPNGEKLTVCKIEFNDRERTIQTTATNVVPGMVVIAFVPGSSLNDIKFDVKELKGLVSEGMLSAPTEFGIAEELVRKENYVGIMAYPEVNDLSLDPIAYLGLEDFIIDIKVLSNRADANSYYSMALELAAYFKTHVDLPTRRAPAFTAGISTDKGVEKSLAFIEGKKDFSISIQDQILLAKSGIKSINDIADLTNLTLIMTGQPTHAYDKKVVGKSFKAELKSGEVKVFGNKDVSLENNLVITSDKQIVSVAGVIGIENKGVSNETKEFILEFGRFNIKDVRKSAKNVKLSTMASNQSSKEFNATLTKWAIAFVSTIAPTLSNVVNEPIVESKTIAYSEKTVCFLAGRDISKDEKYLDALKALSIIGYEFTGDKVKVAPHISGIQAQQDLNEEVFRFYGYDSFKPQAPQLSPLKVATVKTLHKELASQGYQEVVTYSLISKTRNIFNPFGFANPIALETFVSKEREEIRNSMAVSLLEVVEYNQKRKIDKISIFDIGMINDGIKTLGIASTTKSFAEIAKDLKNVISDKVEFERFNDANVHAGVSARITLEGKVIGWIGKLHPWIDATNAFVAEVMLMELKDKVVFEDYSNEPLKQIDVTVAIGIKEDVKKLVDQYKQANVYSVEVIDEFEKENQNHVTLRVKNS